MGADLEGGPERSADEHQPLVPSRQPTVSTAAKHLNLIFYCCSFIIISASLINFNKFMMQKERFPYSVPLTFLHMTGSVFFACITYLAAGDRLYTSMPEMKKRFGEVHLRFIPISIAFAISISLSNEAYKYCSVPFLQMCKEFNPVLVYFLGLVLLGSEKFSPSIVALLILIMLGCSMAVKGELRFSGVGFGLQMGSQCAEVLKILIQQQVMQGLKLDPMTTVLFLAPQCLVCLASFLPFVWQPGILAAAKENWLLLLLNTFNAFMLNVAVAQLIGATSGLTMTICGVLKDITIVTAAALLFRAEISLLQAGGFCIALLGVAAYSTARMVPDLVSTHGVPRTLLFVWFGIAPRCKDTIS